MELDFAILAERAETNTKGLLQLFGGGLNQINAPAFPALAQLAIAMRFVGSIDEPGNKHVVALSILTPAGDRQVISEGREIYLGQREDEPAALLIFELTIAFGSAGGYIFQILADGVSVKELRLLVRQGGVVPAIVAGGTAVHEVPA